MAKLPPLIISDKQKSANNPDRLPVAFRQIERWVSNVEIAASYASLTGPGQTTTPGDLYQAGGFEVSTPASSTLGIQLNNNSSNGITLSCGVGGGNIEFDTHANLNLNGSALFIPLSSLPTTSPGPGNQIWNNGGVLNIGVGGGGGGTAYASLTGAGYTTTPGDLTQTGGFTVSAGSTMGIQLKDISVHGTNGITVATNNNGIGLFTAGVTYTPTAGIGLVDQNGGIILNSTSVITMLSPATYIQSPVATSGLRAEWTANPGTNNYLNFTPASAALSYQDVTFAAVGSSPSGFSFLGWRGSFLGVDAQGPSNGIVLQTPNSGIGGGITLYDGTTNGIKITSSGGGVTIDGRNGGVLIESTLGLNILLQTNGSVNIGSGAGTAIRLNTALAGTVAMQSSIGGISMGQQGTVHFFVNTGNPNGVSGYFSVSKGDICFDLTTPGIWVSTVAGSNNNWVMYTLP